jgi:hypothetical protein
MTILPKPARLEGILAQQAVIRIVLTLQPMLRLRHSLKQQAQAIRIG